MNIKPLQLTQDEIAAVEAIKTIDLEHQKNLDTVKTIEDWTPEMMVMLIIGLTQEAFEDPQEMAKILLKQ